QTMCPASARQPPTAAPISPGWSSPITRSGTHAASSASVSAHHPAVRPAGPRCGPAGGGRPGLPGDAERTGRPGTRQLHEAVVADDIDLAADDVDDQHGPGGVAPQRVRHSADLLPCAPG